MPPEANSDTPSYSTSLDIFSFGVLVLQIFTNKFPRLSSDQFVPIANDPNMYRRVPEIERRRKDLQVLGKEHPHVDVVRKCLNNQPKDRPTTKQLFLLLQAITKKIGCFPSKIELIMNEGTIMSMHIHAIIFISAFYFYFSEEPRILKLHAVRWSIGISFRWHVCCCSRHFG